MTGLLMRVLVILFPGDGGFFSSVDVGSLVGGGGFHRSTVATLASGKVRFL